MKHVLRIASLAISFAGAALGILANAVDNKRQDIKIEEKVNKKFEERFGNVEDSENDEEEGES